MRNALNKPTASSATPFFNVVEQDGAEPAEVWLYGDVVQERPTDWWTGEPLSGLYIALDDVLAELERVRDASEIVVHLNSGGGDLFAGVAIHNLLRSFNGKKTVVVDGLAASAASVIMCAGDIVQVFPGSMVMIHNVASLLFGFYSTGDLRAIVRDHEACETSILRIYGAKTSKPEAELQALIDATTWYVGQDAIDAGFADEMLDEPDDEDDDDETRNNAAIAASVSADGAYLMVAGIPHSLAALGPLPPWLADQSGIPDVAAAARGYTPAQGAAPEGPSDVPQSEEDGEMDITNVASLRAAYPDLVAAIEADAATAERERLREIDNIAGQIRNAELVMKARFDEPMTAAELALAAISNDASAAGAFLGAMDVDAAEATPEDVDAIAPAPTETVVEDALDAEHEAEFTARVHELYAQTHGNKEGNR